MSLQPTRDSPVHARTSDTAAVRGARLLAVSLPTARIRALLYAIVNPSSRPWQTGMQPAPTPHIRARQPSGIVLAGSRKQEL